MNKPQPNYPPVAGGPGYGPSPYYYYGPSVYIGGPPVYFGPRFHFWFGPPWHRRW
jgi:hypothetical protein